MQNSEFIKEICKIFSIGNDADDTTTILTNIGNASRRSNCLSEIENYFTIPGEDGEENCLLNWGENPKKYIETFKKLLNQSPPEVASISRAFDPTTAHIFGSPKSIWKKYPDEKPGKRNEWLICKERVLRYLGTELGHRKEIRIVSYNFDEFNYASADIAAWCYESDLIKQIGELK